MIEIASLNRHLYLLHQHSELGGWRLVLWRAGCLVERILLLCGWLLRWGLLRDYLLYNGRTDVVNTGQTSTLVVEETSRITDSRTLQVKWSQFNDHNPYSDPPHVKDILNNWSGHSYSVTSYNPLNLFTVWYSGTKHFYSESWVLSAQKTLSFPGP